MIHRITLEDNIFLNSLKGFVMYVLAEVPGVALASHIYFRRSVAIF